MHVKRYLLNAIVVVRSLLNLLSYFLELTSEGIITPNIFENHDLTGLLFPQNNDLSWILLNCNHALNININLLPMLQVWMFHHHNTRGLLIFTWGFISSCLPTWWVFQTKGHQIPKILPNYCRFDTFFRLVLFCWFKSLQFKNNSAHNLIKNDINTTSEDFSPSTRAHNSYQMLQLSPLTWFISFTQFQCS